MHKLMHPGLTFWRVVLVVFFAGCLLSCTSSPQTLAARYDVAAADPNIEIAGESIFPFGLYHVSWATDRPAKTRALRAIAEAGFNLMHPALDLDDEEFLDLAHELGVYLIVEVNDPNGDAVMIEAFADHPAILGWLIADDFNSLENDHTPESVAESHELVDQLAPNALTYISGNTVNLTDFMGKSDIVGIQTYSVPSEPLNLTDLMLGYAVEVASEPNVPVFANLQAFAYEGQRPPTNAEIRNVTYQALINGVDGILYYAYFSSLWDMEQSPDMWAGLTEIAGEIEQLTPVLLNGELSRLKSDHPGVAIGQWVHDDKTYLTLVNTTDQQIYNLPVTATVTAVEPMFSSEIFPSVEGRERRDRLMFNLEPLGVQVFVLE